MKLAIIDLDGTLTDTNDVDMACFLQAFADEFEIRGASDDWSAYPHATDSGITEEIFLRRFGRKPSRDEVARVRRRFISLLSRSEGKRNGEFRLIDGADQFLTRLSSSNEWRGAIATGSWSDSALLKMNACGLNTDLPLLCCDDSIERSSIVESAVRAARHASKSNEFERVVLVGDGVWDLTTARALNRPFLGIGCGEAAQRLITRGANVVLPDYRDLDAVFDALDRASVP